MLVIFWLEYNKDHYFNFSHIHTDLWKLIYQKEGREAGKEEKLNCMEAGREAGRPRKEGGRQKKIAVLGASIKC